VIEESVRQVYIPLRATGDDSPGTVIVRASPPRAAAVALAARREVPRLVPNAEAGIVEMADLMAKQYRPWQLGAALFSVFGLLALVVATVGIYSTVASTVGQRRHEFGVRIALGAQTGDVFRLVLRHGARLVGAGLIAGAIVAGVSTRLFTTLMYGVSPLDPVVYVGTAALLALIAFAASYVPALRATRVDPIEALRTE
jgi:putative ABC transport system permease protein